MISRLLVFSLLVLCPHSIFSQTAELRNSINTIIKASKAKVGVAVLGIESRDTVSINGNKMFPMFSVVKFYTALAVLNEVDKGNLSLDKKIRVNKTDLNPDTWSPMRDSLPAGGFEITVSELLRFSIILSDNIAYEKLAELLGGIMKVNSFVQEQGVKGLSIVSTYKEGWERTLMNQNSPWAAVTLLDKFYKEKLLSKKSREFLYSTMLQTSTGNDRIKGLLPIGTPVAHKTGTAGMENGVNLAVNDIGIITLPSGKHFAIAVFITESKESDEANARIIAEITEMVWQYYTDKKKQ